jgi:hypothetical protein
MRGPLACFVDAVAQVGVRDGWQFVAGAVMMSVIQAHASQRYSMSEPGPSSATEPLGLRRWDIRQRWAKITIKSSQAHTAAEKKLLQAAADVVETKSVC